MNEKRQYALMHMEGLIQCILSMCFVFNYGLSFVGWFENGKPVGSCWRFLVGGTYIYR